VAPVPSPAFRDWKLIHSTSQAAGAAITDLLPVNHNSVTPVPSPAFRDWKLIHSTSQAAGAAVTDLLPVGRHSITPVRAPAPLRSPAFFGFAGQRGTDVGGGTQYVTEASRRPMSFHRRPSLPRVMARISSARRVLLTSAAKVRVSGSCILYSAASTLLGRLSRA